MAASDKAAEPAFIYGLRDPKSREIRYIGKSRDPKKRLGQHRRERTGRGCHRHAWLSQLAREGRSPELVILEAMWGGDWKAAERRWIAAARQAGWRLVNGTPGGDAGPDEPRRGFRWSHLQRTLITIKSTERAVRKLGETEIADRIAAMAALLGEVFANGQPNKADIRRARALLGELAGERERQQVR